MAASLGKNAGTYTGLNSGTAPVLYAGSLPGKGRKNFSSAEPLGRHDLIDACQAIVLQFPIKKAAEMQDSTTKAVECQRNGDSAMSLLAAANMCRGNTREAARARAMFAQLFGFTGRCTDPDFMEGMELLAQGYMRDQFARYMGDAPEAQVAMSNSEEEAGEVGDCLTGDLFALGGDA